MKCTNVHESLKKNAQNCRQDDSARHQVSGVVTISTSAPTPKPTPPYRRGGNAICSEQEMPHFPIIVFMFFFRTIHSSAANNPLATKRVTPRNSQCCFVLHLRKDKTKMPRQHPLPPHSLPAEDPTLAVRQQGCIQSKQRRDEISRQMRC